MQSKEKTIVTFTNGKSKEIENSDALSILNIWENENPNVSIFFYVRQEDTGEAIGRIGNDEKQVSFRTSTLS